MAPAHIEVAVGRARIGSVGSEKPFTFR